MQAERNRRAEILKAEGEKASAILNSEGEKISAINNAEAEEKIPLGEGEQIYEKSDYSRKLEDEQHRL